MCVLSNVGDYYGERWKWIGAVSPDTYVNNYTLGVTREEFEALKAEVVEMKDLLRAAKRIDELTGQPDCEMAAKVTVLRRVAEFVGIDLDDVLPDNEGDR